MAAGKELLGVYTPKMVHAGDFPVVTESGTVSDDGDILELMPVTLKTDGKIAAVTVDTIEDVYGIAAQPAKAGEEIVVYLTGNFFASALVLPEGITITKLRTPLRKRGVFLVDIDNATDNTETDAKTTTSSKE